MLTSQKIVNENALPGAPPSEWQVTETSDSIVGYAADFSVNVGETVRFKVKTDATDYRIDVYRLGYYGGLGARKVTTVEPTAVLPQIQPDPAIDASTSLSDFGTWNVSATWQVPADATSGVYVGKLVREDSEDGENYIVFVVRDDNSQSDILFQTSDTTWQAYNTYGGASLYTRVGTTGRAYKVSYNRPLENLEFGQVGTVFYAEYPMIRWLESNGYDVSYFSGIDSDRRGAELLEHRLFMSVGHDEYWSGGQRSNVEAARDAGVNLAFFSANEVYWKTRWESAIDGSGEPYKTLVSYKETHANAKIDPLPDVWTGTWRDPRFSPPADGGRPENALTGTIYSVDPGATTSITVPAEYSQLRFWRDTDIADLAPGTIATLASETLGFEWDEPADNGFRPAGLFTLSSTTRDVPNRLLDQGTYTGPGRATHSLTMYRAPSGSRVFGAGTVQWSWGLGGKPTQSSYQTDVRMQQATVNLLADMLVQPQSLRSGLVTATPSTDSIAPFSGITGPTTLTPSLGIVTLSGTAEDVGGHVAGVEVSIDGGQTWRAATGTTNWTYSWTPTAAATFNVRTRSVDDSGNLETPAQPTVVQVTSGVAMQSIWGAGDVPASPVRNDGGTLEVGVKFQAATTGLVTGLRYYQGTLADTGWHNGHLWASTGQLLATVLFPPATSVGWQQAMFSQPVRISADTTYVVSQFSPKGYYSFTLNYFGTDHQSGSLKALAAGVEGPNGTYAANGSRFPTIGTSTNYWVDVVFAPDVMTSPTDVLPPTSTIVDVAAAAGIYEGATVQISGTARDDGGGVVASVEVSTDGGATWQLASGTSSWTYNWIPPVAGSVTLLSRAVDNFGNAETPSTGLTVDVSQNTSYSVWNSIPPEGVKRYSGQPLELGMKFRASQPGLITSLRYYQVDSLDLTTHTGSLWTSGGQLLATVEYPGKSGEGWRTAKLSNPVAINANTTYIVSQFSPGGSYGVNQNFFTSSTSSGPLKALADGEQGGNGLFRYSSSSAFPASSYLASNYWVDVVFEPIEQAPLPIMSLWSNSELPAMLNIFENRPVQLGTKFRANSGGVVNALRYYQGRADDTTSHIGNLWSSTGQLLATATFSPAGGTGWQQVELTQPVRLLPGQTYIVSQYSPLGYYSAAPEYFTTAVTNESLRALASGEDGGNGVYRYGENLFPNSSYRSTNYWLDVVFLEDTEDLSLPVSAITFPTDTTSLVSGQTYAIAGTATDFGGGSVSKVEVSVDGGSTWHLANGQANWTYSWTPAAAGTATLLSRATDNHNNRETPGSGLMVTVELPGITSYSLFNNGSPTAATGYSESPLQIGMKFRATEPGQITALRFYQAATGDSSQHIGNLWSSTGQLLATGTYAAATSSGWKQVQLSQPVRLVPGRTYIVSQYSPAGFYPATTDYFSAAVVQDPLRALANGEDGGNGVYRYGDNLFPSNSFRSANYWVDVVFQKDSSDLSPPVSTIAFPTPTSTLVTGQSYVITGTSTEVGGGTITQVEVSVDGGASWHLATGLANWTYSWQPTVPGTTTIQVRATDNHNNVELPGPGVVATVQSPQSVTYSLWNNSTPASATGYTGAPLQVGMKFQATRAGEITTLRYYQASPVDSSQHVGNLWSSTGTLLASVTFPGGTGVGWRQAVLSNPVPIEANRTYVVSHYSPQGYYAATYDYFTTAWVTDPLRGLASGENGGNGVYRYGDNLFPNSSTSRATNYWVDLVFRDLPPADTTAPTSQITSPVAGSVLTAGQAYSVSGTATDAGGGTVTKVEVSINGGSTWVQAVGQTNWTYQWTPALGGAVTWLSRATDSNGNVETPGAGISVTVVVPDTAAPVSQIASPVAGSILNAGQMYAISGTASDTGGGTVTLVEVSTDGGATWVPAVGQANWTYDWTPVVGGAVKLLSRATDSNGNIEIPGAGVSVTVVVPDTVAPVSLIVTPIAGAVVVAAETHTISGTSSDTGGGTVALVEVSTDGGVTWAPAIGQTNWTYEWTPVSAGNVVLHSRATDSAGNVELLGAGTAVTVSPPDLVPPTSVMTSPASGSTVNTGYAVSIQGTAVDTGGGTLAQVQVSVDGGGTWVMATGLANWEYIWTPTAAGTATLLSRAIDSSGNVETPGAGVTVNIETLTTTESLWSAIDDSMTLRSDDDPIEVGVKFQATRSGLVTGIRYYHGTLSDEEAHVGHLWNAAGQLLATVTFPAAAQVGWQQALLSAPVPIQPNTTYVVSELSPSGDYVGSSNYFGEAYTNGALQALSDHAADGNGVYINPTGSAQMPDQSHRSTNYWVDLVFQHDLP